MTEGRRYTDRERVLDGARTAVMKERNNAYGPPTQDFDRSAGMLNALGYKAPGGREIQGHDIAVIQSCVKLSRLTWTPDHGDSWTDLAGYAACGLECAVHEAEVKRDQEASLTLSELVAMPIGAVVEAIRIGDDKANVIRFSKIAGVAASSWLAYPKSTAPNELRLTSPELRRDFHLRLPARSSGEQV